MRDTCVRSRRKAADPAKHPQEAAVRRANGSKPACRRNHNVCIGKDPEACLAGLRRDEESGEDEEGDRPVSRQHLARTAGDVLDRIDVYADCVPGCAIRSRDGRDEASPTCLATTVTQHLPCDCPDEPKLNDSQVPSIVSLGRLNMSRSWPAHVRMSSAL